MEGREGGSETKLVKEQRQIEHKGMVLDSGVDSVLLSPGLRYD